MVQHRDPQREIRTMNVEFELSERLSTQVSAALEQEFGGHAVIRNGSSERSEPPLSLVRPPAIIHDFPIIKGNHTKWALIPIRSQHRANLKDFWWHRHTDNVTPSRSHRRSSRVISASFSAESVKLRSGSFFIGDGGDSTRRAARRRER